MQRLRAIVFAAVLLAAGLGHAPVAIAASVDDWRVDLDEISNTLVLQHPDPYTRIGRDDAHLTEAGGDPGEGEDARAVDAVVVGNKYAQFHPE